jgi:hypothetical protein
LRGKETEVVWCTDWGNCLGVVNSKAPTAMLLDKDEHFVAFGYEALQRFSELSEGELDEFSLHQSFKMELLGVVSMLSRLPLIR